MIFLSAQRFPPRLSRFQAVGLCMICLVQIITTQVETVQPKSILMLQAVHLFLNKRKGYPQYTRGNGAVPGRYRRVFCLAACGNSRLALPHSTPQSPQPLPPCGGTTMNRRAPASPSSPSPEFSSPNMDLHLVIPVQNARYDDHLYGKRRLHAILCLGFAHGFAQYLRPVFLAATGA